MASRALAVKPEDNAATSPLATSPLTISALPDGLSPLTKQYVVPPRPKPGRKPATDTPPTRRKAQNRAAQRAFRERRAAKVSELEDELNDLRKDHEAEMAELRRENERLNTVDSLYKNSIQDLNNQIASLRQRSSTLEAMLAERRNTISDEDAQRSYQTPPAIQDGCGNCTTDSRCQCVEDAFEVNVAAEPKRPPSPQLDHEATKRQRIINPEELETEFTTFRVPIVAPEQKHNMLDSNIEPCGFCSDGRACICAEIADDLTSPVVLETRAKDLPSTDGGISCVNGPGSCGTCKTNPRVSIMCQALNASLSPEMRYKSPKQKTPAPCALGEACCRVSSTIAESSTQGNDAGHSSSLNDDRPTLTCAAAFETLSQHKAFNKATQELGKWLPLLKTIPTQPHNQTEVQIDSQSLPIQTRAGNHNLTLPTSVAGMTGFEIEAASVLTVLSFYDRRYGTDEAGGG